MNMDLLYDGLFVMAIGMGMVFFFLTIMIFSMNISSYCLKIINKYFPEEIPEVKSSKQKKTSSKDDEIALAIACAMHERSKVCWLILSLRTTS